VDEQVWLSSNNPRLMILCLRDEFGAARTKAGRRKLRLFQAACFRMIWGALDDEVRRIVETLEQYAEGAVGPKELAACQERAREMSGEAGYDAFPYYLTAALNRATSAEDLGVAAQRVSKHLAWAQSVDDAPHAETHPEYVLSRKTVQKRHAALLREIFGNPYRQPPARKFPAEVRGLAQACFDDPSHYPVLADALADLREDAAAAHCRLSSHVKGCHVVDWVLGKA
jgi:hypothetical protein